MMRLGNGASLGPIFQLPFQKEEPGLVLGTSDPHIVWMLSCDFTCRGGILNHVVCEGQPSRAIWSFATVPTLICRECSFMQVGKVILGVKVAWERLGGQQ